MPLSASEYATIVAQAPILIWRADLSMGCDYFNERWLAFTGRTLAQERGNGWAEGVHADDLARCLEVYASSFATRRPFEMEYRLRRRRERELGELRELIPICARCKNVRDDDGFWERVETYVSRLTHRGFTHGLCQQCLEALYGTGEEGGAGR